MVPYLAHQMRLIADGEPKELFKEGKTTL